MRKKPPHRNPDRQSRLTAGQSGLTPDRRPQPPAGADTPGRAAVWPAVLGWSELALGLSITLLAVVLHVIFLRAAGGLWRDEIQIVNIGLMPTFAEVWKWLAIDTFPLVWPMTVRAWSGMGLGATDFGLRVLGSAIGLGIIGVLWWNARQFCRGIPLFSLALFAICPTVLTFGDSLRGYGLGTLAMLVMVAAVWRAVETGSQPGLTAAMWRRAGLALVAALLAVHCLYFNALILLALGVGGLAVSIHRRDWKPVATVTAIGVIAAVTMLPYVNPLSRKREWDAIAQSPTDLAGLFGQFGEAASSYGSFMIWVWLAFVAASLAACVYRFFFPRTTGPAASKDAALFLGALLLCGPVFYFGFILASRVPSRPWYYIGADGLAGRGRRRVPELGPGRRPAWPRSATGDCRIGCLRCHRRGMGGVPRAIDQCGPDRRSTGEDRNT